MYIRDWCLKVGEVLWNYSISLNITTKPIEIRTWQVAYPYTNPVASSEMHLTVVGVAFFHLSYKHAITDYHKAGIGHMLWEFVDTSPVPVYCRYLHGSYLVGIIPSSPATERKVGFWVHTMFYCSFRLVGHPRSRPPDTTLASLGYTMGGIQNARQLYPFNIGSVVRHLPA